MKNRSASDKIAWHHRAGLLCSLLLLMLLFGSQATFRGVLPAACSCREPSREPGLRNERAEVAEVARADSRLGRSQAAVSKREIRASKISHTKTSNFKNFTKL